MRIRQRKFQKTFFDFQKIKLREFSISQKMNFTFSLGVLKYSFPYDAGGGSIQKKIPKNQVRKIVKKYFQKKAFFI